MACTHPHWTREGCCEDCGARWDAPLDNARRIEGAARRLMSLIDDSSFRDGRFAPGTVCATLRSSGEAIGLRDALRPPVQRDTWHDDSGDDEIKDGSPGVAGYGARWNEDPLPA